MTSAPRTSPKPSSTGGSRVAETGRRSTRGIAILLAALSALGPFSIDAYLPSFPDIAAKLGATQLEVQQTLSV